MNLRQAKEIAGSLSFPTKMPGTSYALPAQACILGSKLAKIKGTTCSTCYALSGNAGYQFANAVRGMARRLVAIRHPQWVEAISRLLKHYHAKKSIRVDRGWRGVREARAGTGSRYQRNVPGYHRWHDSGDLQSVDHLMAICEVAKKTPRIKHWLPTNELGIVKAFIEQGGEVPANLVIRVSSIRINDRRRRAWAHTSSVFVGTPPDGCHECPAPNQEHRCGSCRACWSPEVPHVAYRHHGKLGEVR